jgi:Family of unknown function (DUF5723)
MKKLLLKTIGFMLLGTTIITTASAQGFAGFRSGKKTGVNGVFFNPASIANSNYKWDANLLSLHAGIQFNGSSTIDSFIKKGGKGETIQNYIDDNVKLNGAINVDVYGPSAMVSLDKNSSIAVTSRFRAMANFTNIGGFTREFPLDSLSIYNGLPSQIANINMWKEIGATYATTLARTDDHIITTGISAKYITGAGNTYYSATNFSGTAFTGNDAYLTNTNGRIAIGSSFDDYDKATAKGLGTDIGFIYEKLNDKNATHQATTSYKFRLGISILDIGSIKYHSNNESYGDYNIHIGANEKFKFSEIENKNTTELKNYLDSKPQYFTNNNPAQKDYTVSLPTSTLINMDVALTNHFFMDVTTQINLVQKDNIYSSFNPNYVAITPRYEGKFLSVYLPVTYNEISQLNAGIGIKAGAFYIGSNSLFNSINNDFGQIDVQLGVRIGLKRKK